ncbi:hypothetical protein [Clostridium chauvoei]|uniref:Uncharacterized protein n=3 Tax=Clostridium chauvoei TaxID=46867 RepID=A0A1U6JDX6_9CLOT|nr:hypothetical protein [Clostridium chauvoei]MBX7279521.1 hypothetical protein [Clostridium chauvoei]MBX7281890.1 hypothetical protein [Clostridium chauvoei]MBX7284521.1 hypothetical protein [Clostridium chauvoei]MBX7286934.1 hypothetical protein [Clostridium chauvoei]MBX7289610.1 hypothetical protein [Clostridium chauvoei]
MREIEIHEKLRHLTMLQIESLMNKYYNGVKASDIIKEYNIDTTSSKLYTLFPPIICEDIICPVCNEPMYKERDSKSSYSWNKKKPFCAICGHTDEIICKCNYCIAEREKVKKLNEERKVRILQEKREKIKKVYDLNIVPVNYSELNFREKVFLGALLRTSLSEDMEVILPLNDAERELAPTIGYIKEILSYLIGRGVVSVDSNSSIDAFLDSNEEKDIEFPNVYYITMVKYRINIVGDEDIKNILSKIINPKSFSDADKEDALNIWKEIALEECIEYFEYQMKSVRFDFNMGEKTIAIFKDLLENFSVSQIYGIIYKSVANATKYYQENSVSKKQAANSVIGGCQRYAERAMINNWELAKYSRIKELSQSMISEFFFDRVIGVGSLGFNMPPSEL